MYLRKQKASHNRYRLRIIEKYRVNGVQKEKTLYNIGYIDRNDIQTLKRWEYYTDLSNKIIKEHEKVKEVFKDDPE